MSGKIHGQGNTPGRHKKSDRWKSSGVVRRRFAENYRTRGRWREIVATMATNSTPADVRGVQDRADRMIGIPRHPAAAVRARISGRPVRKPSRAGRTPPLCTAWFRRHALPGRDGVGVGAVRRCGNPISSSRRTTTRTPRWLPRPSWSMMSATSSPRGAPRERAERATLRHSAQDARGCPRRHRQQPDKDNSPLRD